MTLPSPPIRLPARLLPAPARYAALGVLLLAACGEAAPEGEAGSAGAPVDAAAELPDTTDRVAVVQGFSGPEAVRYDPDQDVYFVANFNGEGGARDSNGFISRVGPEGEIQALRFMQGTDHAPLHAPRGMFIVGDTLWVADADGVHGFDRRSGAQLAFVDFTSFAPGFLNDIAAGPDGTLYVTDTGGSTVYRVRAGESPVVVRAELPDAPNGIAWDPAGQRFLIAPWGGGRDFRAWTPGAEALETMASSSGGGNFDGIEVVGARVVVASQNDSTLHVLENGAGRPFLKVGGRPADIGIDTRRGRVAVPYIALDRVDIWALPPEWGSPVRQP